MRKFVVLFFACGLFVSMSSWAAGAVYKCKDANGRMSFQQTPCAQETVDGSSEVHEVWRQMKALSAEARYVASALGADVESIKQCNRSMNAYLEKVNALEPAVNKLGSEFAEMAKAHVYLKDCGMCRASAASYCEKADYYLDLAASKLTEY